MPSVATRLSVAQATRVNLVEREALIVCAAEISRALHSVYFIIIIIANRAKSMQKVAVTVYTHLSFIPGGTCGPR